MALSVDAIIHLYRTAGATRYGMEAIDQERHALQCAYLAEQAGSPVPLVAAALLHDLGHLLSKPLLPGTSGDSNDLHEYIAIPFLRGAFPAAVIEPIRLHVEAKRYLCAVEPGYRQALSPASQRSLELQGGPHTAAEAQAFIGGPHGVDAVALRRWDDSAKSPTRATPGWEHYGQLLTQAQTASALAVSAA